MNLIETKELCKKYGHNLVVDHVNMHVPDKAIYGFVGENGSGKTTIMRLITGLAEPSSGSYSLFDIKNNDNKIHRTRRKISAIVETASLVPTLTALENMIYQELYEGIHLNYDERIALLRKVNLDLAANKKVKNFSLGMRQRLAIALALMNKPKLMLLDEPMNGLDPEGIAELRELLINLNQKDGITVLISSHILSELEKIASVYGFISHGKLIEEITAEELQKRCKKSLSLKVNDIEKTKEIIAEYGLKDFESFPNGAIYIYDNVKIFDVINELNKNNIEVISVKSNEGSVEDYYLNLVKGKK